VKIGLKNSGL